MRQMDRRMGTALATMLLAACATLPAGGGEADVELEKRWGIELIGVRPSAAGYLLDFRYRVVDPERAAPLLDRRIKPQLIDPKTGTRLFVPAPSKVGALRSTTWQPQSGRTCFVLFANPGRMLRPGDRVAVQIGEFLAGDLVIGN